MAVGDVPLTPIIDTVTGTVTEIGRIFLRTLAAAVNGLAPIDAAYWTSRAAGVLSAEVNLGALASGYLKIATAVGIATPTTVPTIPQADITGLPGTLAGFAKLAGGNSFTGAQSIAGLVTVTAFGAHAISGAGTGTHSLAIGNPQAGAGNAAAVYLGNDVAGNAGVLAAYSSTYTAAGFSQPNGTLLYSGLSGGLSLAAVAAAGAVRVYTGGNIERLRITPTGELFVNCTANPSFGQVAIVTDFAAHQGCTIQNTNPTVPGTGAYLYMLNNAGALAGAIVQATAATVSYGTSSDARLKTDHGRAADLAALRALVVHDFTWTADGTRDRGIFAQEAHALFPRAVSPGTDARTETGQLARPWMTDYSKFVADLIVGWQQHDAEIADLRAALAALKGSR